ncbi:MAG: hypothetical protein M1819_000001 [Sarea resinae]|nr:MAG: hypothetical protein M1819_000001 [Sarea resinae]
MAKKRKASSQSYGKAKSASDDFADNGSKLKINTYEDVADSEDEFHMNQDKVLLGEGPDEKRQRKWKEQDEFLEPSDEEVLAYSSASEPEDDSDEDSEHEDVPPPKRARRGADSDEDGPDADEDQDLTEAWGTSKRDYYDADNIETEADALEEEAEARRLQQKQLQEMTEADFGFDEKEWLETGKTDGAQESDEEGGVVTEVLPQLEIRPDMSTEERLNLLKNRYPEFEPLAKEFLDLQPLYNDLTLAAASVQTILEHPTFPKKSQTSIPPSVAVVQYQALSAYLGALSMYFALLTSTSTDSKGNTLPMPATDLRDHAVMESLVKCRETWSTVKDLAIPDASDAILQSNGLLTVEEEDEEEEGLDETAPSNNKAMANGTGAPRKRTKKTKAQRAVEAAQAEAETRRAQRMRQTEEELASLSALNKPSRQQRTNPTSTITKPPATTSPLPNDDADSDFGEETTLTAHEAAEKAARKRSLRFYTSQIHQKSNKRDAASRNAGGDADLPHRERLKDRQVRLNAEAEARGKKGRDQLGAELGGDSDDDDRRVAKELRGEDNKDDDDDYYDLVAARSHKTKAARASRVAAEAEAARVGGRVIETETDVIGPDGKRAITYAIEKNKGLAPRRKKDVRNPRVKKRKKFEEKKKKLASMRQVYKGGEGKGGYAGELTGIKKGLVKSVKL